MSDDTNKNALRSGRIKSALLSLLIGPPLAGFLLGVMAVPAQFFDSAGSSIGINANMFGAAFVYIFIAFLVGAPVAMLVVLVGGLLFARGDVILLRSVLVALTIALACSGLILTILIMGGATRLMDFPRIIMVFVIVAIPTLASAAICWRITRRWHSKCRDREQMT